MEAARQAVIGQVGPRLALGADPIQGIIRATEEFLEICHLRPTANSPVVFRGDASSFEAANVLRDPRKFLAKIRQAKKAGKTQRQALLIAARRLIAPLREEQLVMAGYYRNTDRTAEARALLRSIRELLPPDEGLE